MTAKVIEMNSRIYSVSSDKKQVVKKIDSLLETNEIGKTITEVIISDIIKMGYRGSLRKKAQIDNFLWLLLEYDIEKASECKVEFELIPEQFTACLSPLHTREV